MIGVHTHSCAGVSVEGMNLGLSQGSLDRNYSISPEDVPPAPSPLVVRVLMVGFYYRLFISQVTIEAGGPVTQGALVVGPGKSHPLQACSGRQDAKLPCGQAQGDTPCFLAGIH